MKTNLSFMLMTALILLSSGAAHAARLSPIRGPVEPICPAWGCDGPPIIIVNPTPILPPEPICPAWGCGGPPIVIIDPAPSTGLQDGYWGSNDASLQVDDQGATLQLGCEVGIITGQILVTNGQFTVNGILKSGLGAISIDPWGNPIDNPGTPTTFSGVVNGENLQLSFDGNTLSLDLNAQAAPAVCE